MKKNLIVTGFLLTLGAVPCVASAAPAITGIQGTVSHGQAITISGSGFGTHASYNESAGSWKGSPYLPAAFKDFEDNSLTSQGFNATHLYNVSIQSGGPTNSTKYDHTTKAGASDIVGYGITQTKNTNKSIYTSFWFNHPSGTEGGKPWRWYFGGNSSLDNLFMGAGCGDSSWRMSGDYFAANSGALPTGWGGTISYSNWHKMEIYASYPSNTYKVWMDGAPYLDVANENGNMWQYLSGGDMSPNGHTIELPDMIDGKDYGCGTTGAFDYDDIYIDYTPARVEICNGSTWANRGVCNTQLPTSWSASSVGVRVNQGTFSSGSSKYLYVIDGTNAANPNGIPVTFGSGSSGASAPAAPATLRVATVTP